MRVSTMKATAAAAIIAALGMSVASETLAGGPKHCPPGLAKKGSCVPPGQQKKWGRGEHLPHDIDYVVIARPGDYRLRRPPAGQVYVEIGRDVYLIAEATRKVIEAINLVDAVTR